MGKDWKHSIWSIVTRLSYETAVSLVVKGVAQEQFWPYVCHSMVGGKGRLFKLAWHQNDTLNKPFLLVSNGNCSGGAVQKVLVKVVAQWKRPWLVQEARKWYTVTREWLNVKKTQQEEFEKSRFFDSRLDNWRNMSLDV